jgi:UDP-N-acetylmuramate--alanine ligase
VAGEGRVVAVFQPHRFSRTRIFAEEFGAALGLADEVVVMDVYAAREDPEPGVTGALVAGAVPLPPDRVTFEPSWSAVPAVVVDRSRPGDVLLTIGAGDVTLVGPEVLELLDGRVEQPT